MAKYALIMVFEYQGTLIKTGAPRGLLGMYKDLERSFYIANTLCNIPRRNITVLTDVSSIPESTSSLWEKKGEKEGNPNIIRMPYPSINIVVESMLKFVNNIAYLERDKDRKIEFFTYFSGHGVTFTDPRKEANGRRTSCIILLDNTGKERRYLTKRELIDIFHNRVKIDELGVATIPIILRKMIPKASSTEYIYSASTIMVNSGISDSSKGNRTNMEIFFLYDACQSGSLPGLKYKYIGDNIFEMTFEEEEIIPLSVGVSATNDIQEAPSCSEGSPFTLQMREILKKNLIKNENINIKKLHKDIYSTLHPYLAKRCSPTISISIASLNTKVPIINVNVKSESPLLSE